MKDESTHYSHVTHSDEQYFLLFISTHTKQRNLSTLTNTHVHSTLHSAQTQAWPLNNTTCLRINYMQPRPLSAHRSLFSCQWSPVMFLNYSVVTCIERMALVQLRSFTLAEKLSICSGLSVILFSFFLSSRAYYTDMYGFFHFPCYMSNIYLGEDHIHLTI